jgi:hypothetical protein
MKRNYFICLETSQSFAWLNIFPTDRTTDRPTDQPTNIRAPLVKVGSNCTTGSRSCSSLITYIAGFYCLKNEIITKLHATDIAWNREGILL